MKNKITLALLVSLIWGGGSWWWYTCKIKGFCLGQSAPMTQTVATTENQDDDQATSPFSLTTDNSDDKTTDSEAKDFAEQVKKDVLKLTALNDADKAQETVDTETETNNADTESPEDSENSGTNSENGDTNSDTTTETPQDTDNTDSETNADTETKADTTDVSAEEKAKESTENNDQTEEMAEDDAQSEKTEEDSDNAEKTEEAAKPSPNDLNFEFIKPNAQLPLRAKIYFPAKSQKIQLPASLEDYFARVAKKLEQNKKASITLIGHTDSRGSDKTNKRVGLGRAQQVGDLLIAAGIPTEQIKTLSRGEAQPITSNDTEEGRKLNRRVEMVVDL